jgi:hypothetical protein
LFRLFDDGAADGREGDGDPVSEERNPQLNVKNNKSGIRFRSHTDGAWGIGD